MYMHYIFFYVLSVMIISTGVPFSFVFAGNAGAVLNTHRYAWSENAGWIDFGTSYGSVTITDTALTGYAYGENIGWISLNCANTSSCDTVDFKVQVSSDGDLSGSAWSENAGWIDFGRVGQSTGSYIDDSGVFHGFAWGENIGWISLTCENTASCSTVSYGLGTSWRPPSGGALRKPILVPLMKEPALPPTGAEPKAKPALTETPVSSKNIFPRDLHMGDMGEDVRALQIFLNTHGFPLTETGIGSPGAESDFFGDLTRGALIRFQEAHATDILAPLGLIKGTGYFGKSTRAFVEKM